MQTAETVNVRITMIGSQRLTWEVRRNRRIGIFDVHIAKGARITFAVPT
jgi:hypothetical protein